MTSNLLTFIPPFVHAPTNIRRGAERAHESATRATQTLVNMGQWIAIAPPAVLQCERKMTKRGGEANQALYDELNTAMKKVRDLEGELEARDRPTPGSDGNQAEEDEEDMI